LVRQDTRAGSRSRAGFSTRTPEDPISSELYEELLSGRGSHERKLAVCSGSASLIPAERAELLAVLAEDSNEIIRERAGNALLSQPLSAVLAALQGAAPAAQLFRYCAHDLIERPEIATALARHWRCPAQFLPAAAKRLPTSAVQELMADLERLSTLPALASALLHSASLTAEQSAELRELLREDTESPEALATAVAEAEPDRAKRATLLERLAKMRVVERVQLALKGGREERVALIHDPCKVVQRAVLQSVRLTDREVEGFSAMANLSEEVLRLISMSRKLLRNYAVVRNLINNPKTPLDISLHLLPNIKAQDLKALTANRNIPETLRTSATRLHRQRTVVRSD
jgi:hypothetical protein